MRASELKKQLSEGALSKYAHLYSDIAEQTERFIEAIDAFSEKYGEERDIHIFSVPGRSEISGNHTDHNNGKVLAGAIDRDIIAIAAKSEDGVIRFQSKGYDEDVVCLKDIGNPDKFNNYTSTALVAGLANAFAENGYSVGGFDAYSTTMILKGSGISSSAAFEVMVGNILNHLYNDGKVSNVDIAKYSQYAENVFFGKPCGLMDQMACAVGGFVYIDFENPKSPVVEPISFSLSDAGYSLCIVNTGGNHANLNDDYASVPAEMKAVAKALQHSVLRGLDESELIKNIATLRKTVGDRAILRAIHFLRENERVVKAKDALKSGDIDAFFENVLASGNSSFEYLQNVFTTINVSEQGLSLALAVTDGFMRGKGGAFRVHGGGFAGTIQAFVPNPFVDEYCALMNSVFGEGSVMKLNIRPVGACLLF
ncbi:MAG: galactokinase [Clostridia bacterium]|nr:galactokinase [Clostridia bacterium]